MQQTWVQSLGWEDPLEKEIATHFSILPWKIPWTEVCDIVQEAVIKTIPKKKKCKKAKWLSEEALQRAEKRRKAKGKGEKGKIYPFECRVPKNSRER